MPTIDTLTHTRLVYTTRVCKFGHR